MLNMLCCKVCIKIIGFKVNLSVSSLWDNFLFYFVPFGFLWVKFFKPELWSMWTICSYQNFWLLLVVLYQNHFGDKCLLLLGWCVFNKKWKFWRSGIELSVFCLSILVLLFGFLITTWLLLQASFAAFFFSSSSHLPSLLPCSNLKVVQ